MRTVELKLSAGSLKASWLLAPGCSKSADRIPVLVITDVPDEVTDAAATAMANKTMINTPAHSKVPVKVEYARLGAGKIINLVIGRPPTPPEERKRPRSVTLTPGQSDKLDALAAKAGLSGSAWVAAAIDRAKL